MDLSKDDLLMIEHALTRDRWSGRQVEDLLTRVRAELLDAHDVLRSDKPLRASDHKVTEPKPKGDGWPNLRSS